MKIICLSGDTHENKKNYPENCLKLQKNSFVYTVPQNNNCTYQASNCPVIQYAPNMTFIFVSCASSSYQLANQPFLAYPLTIIIHLYDHKRTRNYLTAQPIQPTGSVSSPFRMILVCTVSGQGQFRVINRTWLWEAYCSVYITLCQCLFFLTIYQYCCIFKPKPWLN